MIGGLSTLFVITLHLLMYFPAKFGGFYIVAAVVSGHHCPDDVVFRTVLSSVVLCTANCELS
jgi:hypothetical protein